jgi:hypothetical protein
MDVPVPGGLLQGSVNLCCTIVNLLAVAKHNKKECSSLQTVVGCIKLFLETLPADSVSPQGRVVLGKEHQCK